MDNIGPDNIEANQTINTFERIRDPSHGSLHPLQTLVEFVQQAGLLVEYSERLTKPMAFHPWMERMQVSPDDQRLLTHMLWDGPARALLSPQGDGAGTTFTLYEGIILAHKP